MRGWAVSEGLQKGQEDPVSSERASLEAGLEGAEAGIGGLCGRNGVPERQGSRSV